MKTIGYRGAGKRHRSSTQRGVAALAAYALALSTVVFSTLPATPAEAAPGDGLCYLIADSGGGNGGNDLLTLVDRGDFNPATNETSIGTGTGTYNVEAMDMHPGTLQLYGANANRLGTIDKITGVYSPLPNTFGNADGASGTIAITDVDGLAFDYNTNVLWGSERQSGNDLLVQIDVVTGRIVQDAFGPGVDYLDTDVGLLGHDDIDDLAFHPQTGVLYASITGGVGGRLVTLNPATGHATDIGPFGAGDIEGMRFDSEGFLWGTSGMAPLALYEININTGAATNPRPLDNGGDYESTVCYVPGSDLQVNKTVDNATPVEGATVTYTVEVFDAGPANATGVVVDDLLPAGVTFASASPSQGTYDETSGVWTVGAVDRRATATLDITATVDLGTAGSTITNTATAVAVDQGDAVPNNDTASVDIFPDTYADLAVAKVVSDPNPGEGDTITYGITVTNNGPNATSGVTIDDALPAGLSFVSSSPSQGTYSSGAGIWTVGALATGAMATLDITATVNSGTALNTITNTATIGNSNVTDPDSSNDSDAVSLVVSLGGLEIVKTSDVSGPVIPGQTITYSLDIANTGTSLLDGIDVTDAVPTGTTFVPGSTQVTGFTGGTYLDQFNLRRYDNSDADLWTTSWVETGETTSPTGGDIQVLNDVSNYQLRIRDRNNSIQRSANLAGTGAATVSFDFRRDSLDRSSEIVYFEVADNPGGPWRELARFVGPATDGSYGNTGGLALLPGELTATTTFRFRTSSAMRNGDRLWVDNFRVDFATPATAAGHDAPGLVTPADGYVLPAGATMQVTFQVVADAILTAATIDNSATVGATGAIPATDSVSDPVAPADLALAKTVDDPAPNPGDPVDFTITVTNNGPSAAALVEVTDLLPTGVTYNSDDGGGAYNPATGVWSVGALAASGSVSVVITATIDPGTAGTTITNSSTITQVDRPDPDPSNNTATASLTVPAVDLAVGKVVDDATPNEGDAVVFTVTVTNNGPDAANGVSIDDLLPAGVTYVSDVAAQGGYDPGTGVWTVGTLAATASTTLDLTATVDAGTFGTTIVNTAAVGAVTETDNDPTNDTATAAITVAHNPAIQVVKTGPASAAIGDTVTYTFTLTHTAASDRSPVTIGSVVDDIAGPAGFVSGDGNGNTLLDGGETWVFTATHLVTAADPDPVLNTVTVTATDADGDALPDATDTHTTDVEHLPVLDVVKTGPASALIGAAVTYTFSVSHAATSDGSPVSAVTLTDDVAGAATFVGGDDGDGLLESGETWTFTVGYTIVASDPDPLVNTGTVTGTDLDGDPVSATGSHSTDVITPASVGDFIWHDLDGDGVADAGEPGLDGVTVNLRDGTGTIVATTITVGGGVYSFPGLAPGDYTVDVDESTIPLAAPNLSTGNEPFPVTLAEGEARVDADFGYYEPASLGDFVWDDLDGDGIQDPGEPGLGGVTVRLYDPADLTTPLATTTTLGDGSYGFVVVPGDYVVEFVPPGGFAFSPVDMGADDTVDSDAAPGTGQTGTVTVTSGAADPTVDAGVYRPVTIGDLVWDDLDGDGVIDAGEPGLGGVTVRVFDTAGNPVGTAVTLADGSYAVALPPGSYDVVVDLNTLPAGYMLTTPGTVTTPLIDSGDVYGLADFGAVLPTYPISGTVWNDTDADTVIDGGEPLLGGVTVELRDGAGAVLASAVTAPDGTYSFPPVPDGDYTVRVDETTLPAGMSSTTGNNPEAVTVAGAAVTGVDFGYAFSGSVLISKTPDSQQVVTGGTVTFSITVTNPGLQDLSGVVVTDPAAPNCNNTLGSLASGATATYSCTLAGVTADFTNIATVAAVDAVGNTVGDADTADVDVINPAITISKTPDTQTILSGGTATFDIAVTNTGDVALSNVAVTDAAAPGCDAAFATLGVGATETYSCSLAGVTADFTNTADVVADHPAGGTVTSSDTADVDVINPAVTISKTPDVQTILSGGTATFDITVTNTGDSPLSNVVVTDALAPGCDATFASLVVGAAESYTCSLAGVTADFTNTADVVADHPAGGTVTDSDTAAVDVINPAVTIGKTPDVQTILSGGTATFDITVTNTGDVALSNVVVTDAAAPGCDATFATLAVGASETYSCTLTGVTADFTNTADVVADHPAGGTVTAGDTADVDVVIPAISIAKTPGAQTILSGDDAVFTITVTNTGDTPLSNVVVTDPLAPGCDAAFATLGIGAVETYGCTLAGVTADFTNSAAVLADDPLGGTVAAGDTADVDVVAPAIAIAKTPDTQTILSGDDATFTITVTNTGDTPLSNVVVTDPLAPGCDATFATLGIGAVETYGCTLAGVTADFTNTADVVADHPAGGTVTATDTADVDVIVPAITIEKTPDSQTILAGATATFSITVTNTGDAVLSNVVVVDPLAPDCDASFGSLAVGASTSYSCTLAGVAADFTNVAVVSADHPATGLVTDSDVADVAVISPAVTIAKTPDTQTILSGGTATFSITATNTGDVLLSNVAVTDALAPGCDATFASLAVGASETYSCTLAGVTADFTNTADVVADHPAGGTVTDSDTADVDVINPAITIAKNPDTQTILSGGTASFDIAVTNTGDATLSNVVVTDVLAPGCDATFASLAVGAAESYTCSLAGVTVDLTNTAVVTADDPTGGTVASSDTADVDVVNPAISISKTPDIQTILSGGTATFTIAVTNTGDAPLSNVVVTDALAPGCDATFASLAVGASESYSCTLAGVTADFTNTADVVADHPAGGAVTATDTADVDVIAPAISIAKTPDTQTMVAGGTATFDIAVTNTGDTPLSNVVVTDPLAPGCDATFATLGVGATESFTCTLAGVTADFTNVAAVTADDPAGGTVTATDTADVDVIAPAITISKTPDTQTILSGGTATFDITVTNTGDVVLSNVAVTDALAPGCDATFASLAVGAVETYSCTLAGVTADFTNTAAVTADHPAGGSVSASDTADVDVIAPAISISKDPTTQQVLSGGTASFDITVTNTGDATLSNVVVTDVLAPGCDATFATLAVGATETYTCTLAGVTADFTNTADVVADHPAGGAVTAADTADVDVIVPAISIAKTPDTQTLLSGGTATFDITVTNTGDAVLSNVVVTDVLAPGCDATFATLGVGATESYTCTLAGVTADFTNTADVTADDSAGGTVTAGDTADVDIVGPAISIAKTPDLQQVVTGGTATFTIDVTNTGDVALSNVVVTDPIAPGCDATFATLAVGAVESYTCTLAGVAADFTNTADVVADHPAGGTVAASDTADVDVIDPGLTISKTPDLQQVVTGGTADFTITVTNTGDVTLANVAVTDTLAPGCSATLGTLIAGASTSYSCTLAGVAADFTNIAVVTGDHPGGGSVSAGDTADVDVIAPAITIVKDPATQQILPGSDATFTITVTNTGDVDLGNVAVTDALTPACNATIGALAAGASTSYSCTLAGVAADFTNTAVVTGDHPGGGSVSAGDTADVDVIAPAIAISKTPDVQQVLAGGTATFTIDVTNTGDVALSNVVVTDALAPGCDATFATLGVGATETYSCTLTGVAADFTNTAVVTADHPAGGTVTANDVADVDVIVPAITLSKDPALQQILAGQDASFTITVTNTGDSPLANVVITDPQAPACDTVVPALGVGASSTVSCAATAVGSGFTNTATVVATHGAGGTVTATDSAVVTIATPAVDIQKTPDLQTVAAGGTADFTITVTNAGTIPLSNVTVTDPLAPSCATTIGGLAVGGSSSYNCSLAGVSADFTNTATVTATDAAGNPATDSDTADVDVIVPAISITKSPDAQTVVSGGIATFTVAVTNTGDAGLSNVVVTDALAPGCDATFASLAVGATESYTCTLAGVTADFTNTADVVADHPAGGTVTGSDTADVTVLVPAIDIRKTPDTQLVGPGGTADFTITVSNTGATPLTDVAVTDVPAPGCDATFATLAVGAAETYSCSLAGVTADFVNTAAVTANDPLLNPVTASDTAAVDLVDPAISLTKTPDLQTLLTGEDATFTVTVTNSGDTALSNVVVTDPLAPGCAATFASLTIGETQTIGCTVAAVGADFTNVASVTADTPLGTTVTATDDALVDVVSPGVDIQKTPDIQQIHAGEDAVFTITVTNTGDEDLSALTVTDPLAPACDTTVAALAVGDATSYSCTLSGVNADLTNIAAVAGTDALGNPVSDSDDAAVDVIAPAISISKTPDVQTVVAGGTATFTIDVANTGDVALSGVTVTDVLAPGCSAVIGDLAAGATSSYTCTLAGVAADFTNTAAVAGTDPIGLDVTDTDIADVTVLVPAIDIQKTPDLQQVRTGDAATFTITVTNAGATPLAGVKVTDGAAPGCDAVIGDLAVGAATSYSCTLPGVTADFTNSAAVTGGDPLGNPVTDRDTADVDVIAPAISISKSPDGQTVVVGGTATFTIDVTNTGDTDLSGVIVTDPLVPACDLAIGDLTVGAATSYTCTAAGVAADFTNTASVAGTDPIGLEVADADTADVTVLVPGIDIQKTPDVQTVVEGDTATFTIIVTNIGTTDLSGVTVTDALAPACDFTIGDLPVGSAPVTYTCDVVAATSFTNTATVDAVDPIGSPLSAADTADVVALVRSDITGTIAHDIAGDGAISGDPGLAGVDVTATWAGLDGVFGTADDEVFVAPTDGNGDYSFDLVPPGDYRITVDTADLPAGIDFQTLDPDAVLDDATGLTLPAGTTVAGVDFAYTATGSIGDTVFFDVDGSGSQDPGEPGLGGIGVTVTWHGLDGVLGTADDLVFTTTTAPDGTYLVDGLPAGDFTVVIDGTDVPPGLSGDLDRSVTLAPAESRDDVDFPLAGAGTIGDQVFEDLDHDGVFDTGEPGVAGVTVNLTWAGPDGVLGSGDDVTFTTVTDGSGRYGFSLLPAGDFLVALDDSTVPADLGSAPPVTVALPAAGTDLTADFPLVGNRPPVAVDDAAVADEDTPVTITVLDDDSDPDGHSFTIDATTDPANGTIAVNADGTITYTPNPGFTGTDTFTYTICEGAGEVVGGVPATGLCDTATVTVVVNDVNEPPGPAASFQSVVVGDPVDPIPVSDPEGGPVAVTFVSGELPPGLTLNPDGSFTGVATDVGVYTVVVEVCDGGEPQMCIEHTHTIAVTPRTLPGPGDDPGPDSPPDTLPFTGANFAEMFWASMMMLLTGAALVLFTRRRNEA